MQPREIEIIKARGVLQVGFSRSNPSDAVMRLLIEEKLVKKAPTDKGMDLTITVFDQMRADLDKALETLDKIRDPRKRHSEPDKYTELGCVMNMAEEAFNEITERAT